MPRLLRRREVCLPTLWGWLLLLSLLGAVAGLVARQIGPWLAVTEPARVPGGGRPLLIVEGWAGERELDEAAAHARRQGHGLVITSGGPITSFGAQASYAERAAQYLQARLPAVQVQAVPAPPTAQDRSYASAVWVRDWIARQAMPVPAIEVYTVGVHARRTRLLYRMAFGEDTQVGIVAGKPQEGDLARWWTRSDSAKDVAMEIFSLAWTQCCFWPAERGSHEERWATPPLGRPASAP